LAWPLQYSYQNKKIKCLRFIEKIKNLLRKDKTLIVNLDPGVKIPGDDIYQDLSEYGKSE
jgi:hypothetical protein